MVFVRPIPAEANGAVGLQLPRDLLFQQARNVLFLQTFWPVFLYFKASDQRHWEAHGESKFG